MTGRVVSPRPFICGRPTFIKPLPSPRLRSSRRDPKWRRLLCWEKCCSSASHRLTAARRGTAYGVFNTGYGLLWFAGSALMGVLYDVSLPALIVFSVLAQLLAVPLLFRVSRTHAAV